MKTTDFIIKRKVAEAVVEQPVEQIAEVKPTFPEFTIEAAEAEYAKLLGEDAGVGGVSAGGIATSMGGGNGFANGGPGTISRAGKPKKFKNSVKAPKVTVGKGIY